jgi:glucokinase
MGKAIAAVDLGGTNIRAALYSESGEALAQCVLPTLAHEGLEPTLGRIFKAIEEVLKGGGGLVAIGVGAPGPLDPWKGVIFSAPNLPGWENVPLAEILAERFGVPAFVGNDANVAALAEHRLGAGRGFSDIIYITVSTGIGGGIIADGKLLLGAKGFAGEVGHIVVKPDGPQCGCGGKGCVEALASGTAIAREALRRIKAGESSSIPKFVAGPLESLTAKEVAMAAMEGDALAQDIFKEAGYYLGLSFVSLIHIFNPSRIIIGGGVAKVGRLLLEPAEETVKRLTMREFLEEFKIVPAALGDEAGLLGAYLLAKESLYSSSSNSSSKASIHSSSIGL